MSVIFFLILLVWVLSLQGRIQKLEKDISGKLLSSSVVPAVPTGKSVSVSPPTKFSSTLPESHPQTFPPPTSLASAASIGPQASDRFVQWLREDWLLKLGAFLLFLGFGWFVTYAFMNNWIGPVGRITLGLLSGVLIMVLGWVRMSQYVRQGGVFLALGSAVILLTTFSAREIYDFFTPFSALAVMFLSTVFVALASVRFSVKSLAVVGLVLAALAPVLTNAPRPDHIGLFSYLLVIVMGMIWIVFLRGWRELTFASLLVVGMYGLPYILGFVRQSESLSVLPFAYVFALVFFITNTAGMIKSSDEEPVADMIAAAGNGLLLLLWILSVISTPNSQALLLVLWTLMFSTGAFFVYRATGNWKPFSIYAAGGIGFLAAATAVLFDGSALTIAYTIECAIMSFTGYVLTRNVRLSESLSWFFLAPVILSAESVSSYAWGDKIISEHFFTILIVGLALFFSGYFFWEKRRGEPSSPIVRTSGVLLVTGSLYWLLLLWLLLHNAFEYDIATTFSLVVYTIIGLILYLYGRARERKGLRAYGTACLCFVVARLLLVEVWDMALETRIITFFAVGILLMSTAFVARKRKEEEIVFTSKE